MAEPAELDVDTALGFLAGRVELSGPVTVRKLGGGVSNSVVLVEDAAQRVVLKQSLPRLRVREEWLAERTRIHREWEVIRALRDILPAGRLPALLFQDRRCFLYAMRAAPAGGADWRTRLLGGECSAATARIAGATLGLMVRGTWGRPEFRRPFSDRSAFDQLRTDPYYRTVAMRHPRLEGPVADLIAESSARQAAMVHGDWSPKNLLVCSGQLVCIDFECAHFGDPSYDAGFMLNHLVLKAFYRPSLAASYFRLARTAFCWTLAMLPGGALSWFEAASMRHLAFLMLARIDGKSPAEYLGSEAVRDAVRKLAMDLIDSRPATLDGTLARAGRSLDTYSGGNPTRRP